MPEPHIALLRGINVGGKHSLPMAELVRLCAELGCQEVRSYLQSGNVIGQSELDPPQLEARLAEALAAFTGFPVPVVVRTRDELAAVVAANPFARPGTPPTTLHVVFLARQPDPAAIAALDPARSPGDELRVRGREVYLHLPGGMARTRFTSAYLDRTLGTIGTARNWNTVLKLLELAT